MDLNRIYAAHQEIIFEASRTGDPQRRGVLMDQAADMALRIARNRLKLGAAAACAWSASAGSLRPLRETLIR